jgi:hypothetical protein
MLSFEKAHSWRNVGKYVSARDSVLDAMVMSEWSNRSDGDVDSPFGYFALVCNSRAEMFEVLAAFADETAAMVEARETFDALQGNFVVVTDSQGFVHVAEYPTRNAAEDAFFVLARAYAEWASEADPEA